MTPVVRTEVLSTWVSRRIPTARAIAEYRAWPGDEFLTRIYCVIKGVGSDVCYTLTSCRDFFYGPGAFHVQ